MFVLFTSHASLRRAAQEVRAVLGSRWPILVQGEAPRDALLRRFREAENAILLGTDSFWEGVDVPGRALRTLVLEQATFQGAVASRSRPRDSSGWRRRDRTDS